MKIKEIRDKQTAAIELETKELQKHLFDLRTQAVTEKLENPSLLRKTRKDIAKMKTILRLNRPRLLLPRSTLMHIACLAPVLSAMSI